jgi:hypothetical protein
VYGKHFKRMYTGSMVGSGPDVFAVWGYIIAHAYEGTVELNPVLISAAIGGDLTVERVNTALEFLEAPDNCSTSKDEDGRRIVRVGEFLYRVVNHVAYRSMRNEADRREYNRVKQRESRARRAVSNMSTQVVKDVSHGQPRSAHAELREEKSKRGARDGQI